MKKVLLISLLAVFSFCRVMPQEKTTPSFSDELNVTAVKKVMKAVADWQINTPLTRNELDWTNAALYAGMAEWAAIAGDIKYYEWLKGIGEKNGWKYYEHPRQPLRRYHADDYCVGQMYIELYRQYKDKKMIAPMRTYLDQILADPAKGELLFVNTKEYSSQQRWSWCDALFMAPTVWAKMAKVTKQQKYLDFMYQEYKFTTDYLYDKDEDLYYRDSNYFTRKEANGAKVFWGRGNGWVYAGLPIIIREFPKKYAQKDYFVTIYKEMSAKLLSLQDPNGYWHASMLDPDSYPNPEMSATSFFVFGMAWGINNGYLETEKYLPAVIKGWKSMVASVWPEGKLGFVQPVGSDPKAVTREMTDVYGVGGFLLAGTEITRLIDKGIIK
jgi:unsaturated rhamnogalacturonyl hydrolase